ncbi:MAG TPA: hypothetical protein VM779_01405 [Thermoanaerobaculia bacterium]|nr:hypothetical protein [Thermoanaerobaculia bacterium]
MTDRDADGLPDDDDPCPSSDTRSTVTLGSCETTAPNVVVTAGCTLADQLAQLRAEARTHGQFVSAASHLLNQLVAGEMLSGAEKGAVESCAARWKL